MNETLCNAMTLASVESQVIALGTSAPAEAVAELLNTIQVLKREIRRVDDLFENIFIEWIQANGDLQIGDVRYYVGTPKDTKCINVPATLAALLEATGGDFDRVCGCLSSNAIKHGAAKKVLPEDEFSKLFSVTEKVTLEEGKPKKSLLTKNDRY